MPLGLASIWAGVWLLATAPFAASPFAAVQIEPSSPLSALTAVAAVTLLGALAAVALRAAAVTGSRPPVSTAPVIARAADRRASVPRVCDPDAAGRPRPRAPSVVRAA